MVTTGLDSARWRRRLSETIRTKETLCHTTYFKPPIQRKPGRRSASPDRRAVIRPPRKNSAATGGRLVIFTTTCCASARCRTTPAPPPPSRHRQAVRSKPARPRRCSASRKASGDEEAGKRATYAEISGLSIAQCKQSGGSCRHNGVRFVSSATRRLARWTNQVSL